ncbi:MAG: endonuclease III [Dehalococcoidia bacterium]|nr:MAG: endonuclease III [Dehalococcoidia bacterium]
MRHAWIEQFQFLAGGAGCVRHQRLRGQRWCSRSDSGQRYLPPEGPGHRVSLLSINEITRLLAEEYGNLSWSQHRDPLSELIMTILSQNTSDHNSRRAFDRLITTFGNWQAVAEANVEEIAQAIRYGGLAQVKAPRIKKMLDQISAQRGSLDLMFLQELPLAEAKAWLQGLPGVGPKTASCVLLFSLGKPALPVDTHIHRVAKRLGVIDSRASAERAHEILGAMVPAEDVYQFHIHMIEHGRRVCKAQRPHCHQCVLRQVCPTGQMLLGTTLEHKVTA